MITTSRRVAALVSILFAIPSAAAQEVPLIDPFTVDGVSSYSDEISRPESILGYQIGEQHTRPHLIVEYFRTVAEESDRVVYGEHGLTYQKRRLVHAVVTSPRNHARLDGIREANQRLSQEPGSVTDAELQNMPVVVWMGYGVHGNEASSFEAAMLLLYHLAAGNGPAVQEVLENTVVILIPSYNPDGHARHVHWVNSNRGRIPTADPQNREHNEMWPTGRTNHYWFDLNRDWLPLQHPESSGRMSLYNEWRPQFVTDFHEMGSDNTYFFQPGVPGRYNPHIPTATIELLKDVGAYHAAALDRIGTLYYTGETFDDFYVGKGSTYPMVTGALGILFEQASSRALIRETAHGLLTYSHTIRNQFMTSLSSLEAAVELREVLLGNQREFYRSAGGESAATHLIGWAGDRTRAALLAEILLQHRIEIYDLAEELTVGDITFHPGKAYVLPANQPESRLISAVMNRTTEFEDSVFYDVSSWSLPLAFNLDYAVYDGATEGSLGPRITEVAPGGGQLHGGHASFAYLIEWDEYFAPRALYRIMSAGVRAQVIMRPVEVRSGGTDRTLGRGTILVPVRQWNLDAETVHREIETAIEKDHVIVHAVDSGISLEGPDLGSPAVRVLERPEVAVLAGSGMDASEVGEVWHLMNERFEIPVSLIGLEDVRDMDLSKYNTIVMVEGSFGRLTHMGASSLRDWVQAGGLLIASRGAVRWLADQNFVEVSYAESDEREFSMPFESIPLARDALRIGGSIFEIEIDNTHPLGFGFESQVPAFRNHETFYEISNVPGTTVGRYSDSPLLSGYASGIRLQELAGSGAIFAVRSGRGRIVMFADNPNFRAFWHGTNRLFLNAVFFGRSF